MFIVMYVLYSVSLCCFVYWLCVNVYLQLPPGLNPIAVKKIYQYINSRQSLHGFSKDSFAIKFWNVYKERRQVLCTLYFL